MERIKTKNLKSGHFNKRAFVSTGLFISGLGLPITGLFNHYLAFDSLTIERHAWMSAHNVLGVLFLLFAIFHVIFNWKGLVKYIKNSVTIIISREALVALSMIVFFLVLIVSHAYHVH